MAERIDFDAATKELKARAEEDRKHAEETIRKIEMLKELEGKNEFTEADIKQVMSVTCFGSPAYCCGLEKGCFWRNSVLQVLRISKGEYRMLKDEFTEAIVNFVKKSPVDEMDGYRTIKNPDTHVGGRAN